MKAAERSTGTIIVGPHRCGTSLVTRLIAGLDHDLGGDLIPAAEDNLEGYWEHREVVEIHNDFLRAIGRSWSDPLPLESSVFSGEEAAAARSRIEEVFERDFQGKQRWALKDPRLCRLLPLWNEILSSKDVSISFVHVVRLPIAAAASLEKRDGIRLETALLLWLRHMIEAERSSRGYRRSWIALEDIQADPVAQASRLAAWLDPDSDETGRDIETLMASVFHPNLLHNKPTPDDPTLNDFPWVAEVYRELSAWTVVEDPSRHGVLDQVLAKISTADRLMIGHPLTAHQSAQREERLKLREEIEDCNRTLTAMRAEIAVHRQETDHLRSLVSKLQHLVARIDNKHAELLSRSLDLTSEIEKKHVRQTREFREVQKNAQRLESDLTTLHTAHELLGKEYRRVVEHGAHLEEEIRNKEQETSRTGHYITDLEEEIRNKEQEISRAGHHITDLEEEIRNKEQETSRTGHYITDLETTLRQATTEKATLEAEQARLHGLIDQLKQELDRSKEACASTIEALNGMTTRLSWRITAPLRTLRGLLPSRRV